MNPSFSLTLPLLFKKDVMQLIYSDPLIYFFTISGYLFYFVSNSSFSLVLIYLIHTFPTWADRSLKLTTKEAFGLGSLLSWLKWGPELDPKNLYSSQVWRHLVIISALGRWRQADLWGQGETLSQKVPEVYGISGRMPEIFLPPDLMCVHVFTYVHVVHTQKHVQLFLLGRCFCFCFFHIPTSLPVFCLQLPMKDLPHLNCFSQHWKAPFQ